MKQIFIFFTFIALFSIQIHAQDTRVKAFDRPLSIELGGLYTQLLGTDSYKTSAGLGGGYGYFGKIHAQLKGFRYLGMTLGWTWQTWQGTSKDTTVQSQYATYVGGGAWSIGLKYYPFRHFYLGVEGTLNNLKMKTSTANPISKSLQIGAKFSLNKEFFIKQIPLEIGLAGVAVLPSYYPRLYGVNLSVSTRI